MTATPSPGRPTRAATLRPRDVTATTTPRRRRTLRPARYGGVDVVIVGGGIAGLSLALRARTAGCRVLVLERGLCGSGASVGNSGIIHSPVYYLRAHPDTARVFNHAQALFRYDFPQAGIADRGWFYGEPGSVAEMRARLDAAGLPYQKVSPERLRGLAPASEVLACSAAIEVPEFVLAPRMVVCGLLQRCLAAGVRVETHTPVKQLLVAGGRVRGVEVGCGQQLPAEVVVLAAGQGLHHLLGSVGSRLAGRLRSRAQVMIALANRGLSHPLQPLDKSGAGAVPTSDGLALIGRDDLHPDLVVRPGLLPLSHTTVQASLQAAMSVLPGVLEPGSARAWVEVKTDVASTRDLRATNPSPLVVDHQGEGIAGLYSFLPGKLTLAYHASAIAAHRILGLRCPLPLPPVADSHPRAVEHLVEASPWTPASQQPATQQPATQPPYSSPSLPRAQPLQCAPRHGRPRSGGSTEAG